MWEGITSLHSWPSCITVSFPFPECWITAAHLGRANARHTHTIFSATVFDFCPSSLRLFPVFIGLRDYRTFLFRHTEHACQVGLHYSQSLVKPGLLTVEFGWLFCTFCAKTVCQQQLSIYLKVLKKEQRLLLTSTTVFNVFFLVTFVRKCAFSWILVMSTRSNSPLQTLYVLVFFLILIMKNTNDPDLLIV